MNPLALLALLGLGAMDTKVAELEREAAHEIASRLPGPAQVRVNVKPDGLDSFQGHLASATITASGFAVSELPFFTEPERSQFARAETVRIALSDFTLAGLHVQKMTAEIPDCRYDRGLALARHQFRVSKSGVGWGSVVLSEQDIADYIAAHATGVETANVRIFSDVIWIEVEGTFFMARTNMTIVGRLVSPDGYKLVVEPIRVIVDWRRADPSLVEAISKAINPVIDIAKDLKLYDALTIEQITLRDGLLTATGKARIPVKPSGSTTDNKG